jgi:hypothetical protein
MDKLLFSFLIIAILIIGGLYARMIWIWRDVMLNQNRKIINEFLKINQNGFPKKLKKVSMDLSPRTLNTIEELSISLNEPNKTGVIVKALEITKYIVDKEYMGAKILIKESNGNVIELKRDKP